jgi:hypothetical protein
MSVSEQDKLNDYQKDVLHGACRFCGKFRHPEYENMTNSQLNEETVRLSKMDVMTIIDVYGDQQGNIGKMGCIAHEIKNRYFGTMEKTKQ